MPQSTVMTLADEEALEAVKAFWDKEPLIEQTNVGPLETGRLKGPHPQPYARASSELASQQFFAPVQTNSPYRDYRHVKIEAWGTRAQMIGLAQALAKRLAWLPRDGRTLTFPDGVAFVVCKPENDPQLIEEKTKKSGQDVWNLVADYTLETTRHVPG